MNQLSKIIPLTVLGLGMVFCLTAKSEAQSINPGNLIQGNFSTVYYYGADGNRYIFPDEATYFTWYDDFAEVKKIDNTTLGSIPLAGNVTYRPGTRMLKLINDPKTYVVEHGGTLRWLKTEIVAKSLYGDSWSTYVDDIPDAFFPYYNLGEPIEEPGDHDRGEQQSFAENINIDLGLETGKYNVPQAPVLAEPGDSVGSGNPFTVSWSEIAFASYYKVEEDTDINFSHPTTAYLGSGTSFSDSISSSEAIIYYYRVKAVNAAGSSNWSETKNIAVAVTVLPSRPELIDPGTSFTSGTAFNTAWISSTDGIIFEFERDTSTAFNEAVRIYSGPRTAVAQTLTVEEDTTYYFRVRARSNSGYSDWSSIKDILILAE
ncbi:MAG: hypothetical protein ABH826_00550 [Patescibacteria group bacterium]